MPTAQSNVEKYLAVIAGHDEEIPTQPASRVEWYLNEILQNGGSGGGGGSLKVRIVPTLPAAGVSGILYLVPSQQGSGQNLYDEYVWVEDETKFELLGQTGIDIDLSGYVPNTRKVGGKTLERDVGITISGASPVHIADNGTATTVAYEISHEDSGVTAGSKGDAVNQTPDFGETFKTLYETVDAKGHVTDLSERTVKIPDAKATASKDGLMPKEDKAKLDKLVAKGSATKGVYIDSGNNTREMSYELKAEVPENFAAGTKTPLTDGAASTGVSMKYAREDHVHPTDASRASVSDVEALETENALLRELIQGVDAPIFRTASGNPATFPDGYDNVALRNLTVTITPTQEGTPSVETPVPIPGYDSLTITRTGRNLAQMYLGNATSHGISYSLNNDALHCEGENTDRTSSFSGGNYSSYAACPWKFPAGTYTLTVSGLTDNDRNVSAVRVIAYPKSADSSITVAEDVINGSVAFTLDEPFGAWFWVYVRPGKSVNQDVYIQIERGTQASPYETYRGQSVSVPLSSVTVYGGKLDAISGTLIVTHGNIASYNGETVPDGWISSTGQLSTGAQVVYPLASPLSYSLTPVSLTSLSGYNCVYADAGTLSVTYRADTQITLGG